MTQTYLIKASYVDVILDNFLMIKNKYIYNSCFSTYNLIR